MGHNPFVLPPGPLPAHFVLSPGHLDALDQYASESIDGVGGGTYTPSSPIVIGGAGLVVDSESACIRGALSTGRDARGLVLDEEVPGFNGASRARKIVVPLRLLSEFGDTSARTAEDVFDPYGVKSLRTTQGDWYFAIPSHRLHHGATLLSARLRWRSGRTPSSIGSPTSAPAARLMRIKAAGFEFSDYGTPPNYLENSVEMWRVPARANSTSYIVDDIVYVNSNTYRCIVAGVSAAMQPTMSTTLGANQVDGTVTWRVERPYGSAIAQFQVPPIPLNADVTAYHNDGLPQDLLIRLNMNNVIDTETYDYRLQMLEPGGDNGVSYGNIYHSLELTMGNITSLREP